MSEQLISHSPDLKQLRDEGYDIEIKSGYLLLKDVPYVSSNRQIKRGILVSKLTMAGDVTGKPEDHVVYFIGEFPCRQDGTELGQLGNPGGTHQLGDLVANHAFSAKPTSGAYEDYYAKMTNYVAVLTRYAQAIDPNVTAKTFPVIEPGTDESVFNYMDTASSRAEIVAVTKKLEAAGKIAIIGLGGTGSYVLDLVAKTPVKEIHLFDGDTFWSHNAFRAPGAASVEELRAKPLKVTYLRNIYSKMHRGIVSHETFIHEDTVAQLAEMNFVFLCLDSGDVKRLIIEKLEEFDISFIDVGMGISTTDDLSLIGILRVTTSSPAKREHIRGRIPLSKGTGDNEYDRNIQIADLNALNAALAVIKWKKLCGFYLDLEKEHFSAYTIDGNHLANDDKL